MKQTRLYMLLMMICLCTASICTAARKKGQITVVPPKSYLTQTEIEIWNDPAFEKQFAESYLAETEIEPGVNEDEREQMLEILEFIQVDNLDEAAKLLQKEIDRNELVSAVYDFTLANLYFQQENLEPAAIAYEKAVEKFPKFRRAWRNLGLIYVRQSEFEKAIQPLTKVIELGGSDSVTYGLLGYAYSSVEKHIPAESAYRMAVLLDPDTLDWKMGLARSFFKQKRFAEAAALCGQLIKDQPEKADLWLLQANAYIGLNQSLKAVEIYEIVNNMGQATSKSLKIQGDIYFNEKLYSMATNAYIEAMRMDSQYDLKRATQSAKVLIARSAFEDTRRLIAFIETQYEDRLDTETRKDLLKIRARLAVADGGGDDEEVQVLKEIVELDPQDGEALILLGQHAARTGNDEKAIFYYEQAAYLEDYEADAKIRHAQLLVGNGKYNEALPLLRRAQTLKPRDNIQEYLEQVERVAKNR